MYFILGTILLIVIVMVCWASNLLMLPGNWGILTSAIVYAWLVRWLTESREGLAISTLVVLAILALSGELIEAMAGAAGAAKQGGSRRGAVLSLLGALLGSVSGAVVGLPVPIPIVASAVGAVLGGAMGAFCGAALGEYWKGQEMDRQIEIGRAAFLGRLLGTVGKLIVGIVMVVIVAVAAVTGN